MAAQETDEQYFARRMAEEAALEEEALATIEEITGESLLACLAAGDDKEQLAALVAEGVISQEQLDWWLASK